MDRAGNKLTSPPGLAALAADRRALAADHVRLALHLARPFARRFPDSAQAFRDAAILSLCRAAQRFDPTTYPGVPFGAFLTRTVRGSLLYVCRRYQRARKNRPVQVQNARPGEEFEDSASASVPADLSLDARDNFEALCRRLPATHAAVIRLTYRDDLSQVEIGRRVGIAQSAVSVLHRQALTRLARHLKGDRP